MMTSYQIMIGADSGPVFVPAKYMNRHGLIAGATGTGKSVSLMGLAESLSRIGVPSLVTDIKGDLSGLVMPSDSAAPEGLPGWQPQGSPVDFLDVFRERGAPLTTTIRAMGPVMLARALSVTDTQAGVLEIAFAVAEDYGRDLDTLRDLREVLTFISEDAPPEIRRDYGLVTPSSVAALGRAILRMERAGGAAFFSHSPLDVSALMDVTADGRGVISMLDCVRLIREPRLYAAVIMVLLDRLSATLPEVGDTDKPRFCLFIDEGHLIFDDCPAELLRVIDQTVRLIRSKGVGIYFATQSPSDLPDTISRQLHLRIQHALRSVTPADSRAVKAAAQSMPAPSGFRAADVIGTLKKGSALVSYMDETGTLTPARVVAMALPRCRLYPLPDGERRNLVRAEPQERTPSPVAAVAEPVRQPVSKSDRDHGLLYWGVMMAGLISSYPWIGFVSGLRDVLPDVVAFILYGFPVMASLGVIAGLAQGRALHAQRNSGK